MLMIPSLISLVLDWVTANDNFWQVFEYIFSMSKSLGFLLHSISRQSREKVVAMQQSMQRDL